MTQKHKLQAKRKIKNLVLTFVQWTICLICTGFVLKGVKDSVSKYLSPQLSLDVTVKEPELAKYPSVTFCRSFNGQIDLSRLFDENKLTFQDIYNLTSDIGFRRQDILMSFSHSENGNFEDGTKVLFNDSNWVSSIPHLSSSGMCHTYNPTFLSHPTLKYGIRFAIKFSENLTQKGKESQLENLNIFIHDRDQFTFYDRSDDRPSMKKLDTAFFKYRKVMLIDIRQKIITREKKSCEPSGEFKFNQCIERTFSERRGCQLPWYAFPGNSDIPVCGNVEEIMETVFANISGRNPTSNAYQHIPSMGTYALSKEAGCPVPCSTTKYDLTFSYRILEEMIQDFDAHPDWLVILWFKNFQFQYLTEYIICDWTCLLGEIGGNVGFFLGGSILAYFNLFYNPIIKKFS